MKAPQAAAQELIANEGERWGWAVCLLLRMYWNNVFQSAVAARLRSEASGEYHDEGDTSLVDSSPFPLLDNFAGSAAGFPEDRSLIHSWPIFTHSML